MMNTIRRTVSLLLIATLLVGSLPVAAASTTGLVGTHDALSATQATTNTDRQQIREILARDDVQQQLLAQGVDPSEVQSRVAALSDDEARQMAAQLEDLPAGASVVGALFAVFIILLVTDILGLTDVYPFTR